MRRGTDVHWSGTAHRHAARRKAEWLKNWLFSAVGAAAKNAWGNNVTFKSSSRRRAGQCRVSEYLLKAVQQLHCSATSSQGSGWSSGPFLPSPSILCFFQGQVTATQFCACTASERSKAASPAYTNPSPIAAEGLWASLRCSDYKANSYPKQQPETEHAWYTASQGV